MHDEPGERLEPGLWLVATPIGNLEDLSPRAARVLRLADHICCEDTRRTGTLLKAVGVRHTPLIVANDHTEHGLADHVTGLIAGRQSIALVSDAGTPAISDPGRHLVNAVRAAGLAVHCVPGPAAFVMAVVLSGLPTDRLMFEGFLPRGGPERRARIGEIARSTVTTAIYEAPHRVARTLADLREACGDERRVSISREMTKIHEQTVSTTLAGAVEFLEVNPPRGEYVIVVEGAGRSDEAPDDDRVLAEIALCRRQGMSTRDTVEHVSVRLGIGRNRVYDLAVGSTPEPAVE